MKIRDIKTYVLKAPLKEPFKSATMSFDHRNSLLVKVVTDDGFIGWGEAGQFGPPELPKVVIDEVFKPFLIGRNPLQVEKHWEDMYNFTRDYGQKGSVIEAISGIDIALWDIKGKYLNQPVSMLLGSRFREKVAAYATGLYYKPEYEIEDFVEEAYQYYKKGFTGIKIKIGCNHPKKDVEIVKRIRNKIGEDFLISIDANHAYNANTAIRVGKELEKYNIYWFEEPVIPEDINSYLEVKDSLTMAVAAGECEFTQYGFKDLITRRAVDIAQADVSVSGGFTACRKIMNLARLYGVQVVPHIWGSAVAMYATLQFIATIPDLPAANTSLPGVNAPLFEYDQSENPLRENLAIKQFKLEKGYLSIPKKPGLGMEIDESVFDKYVT